MKVRYACRLLKLELLLYSLYICTIFKGGPGAVLAEKSWGAWPLGVKEEKGVKEEHFRPRPFCSKKTVF